MIKLTWLAIPLLVVGALIAACGGGDSETIDLGDGEEVTASEDLPDDFPDDFPVYDGADVLGSISGESEGQEGAVVSWETGDDVEDVEAFYEQKFEDGPWNTTSEGSFGGLGNFTVENGDQAAFVLISETDGNTMIVVTYGSKSDLGVDDSSSDGSNDSAGGHPTADDGDSSSGDEDDSSSGSADLPDEVDLHVDFPLDEIPLPDDARVTRSSSLTNPAGSQSIFVDIYVKSTVEEVADYYAGTLEAAGYKTLVTEGDGEVYAAYAKDPETFIGDSVTLNIADSDVDGYVLVNLALDTVEPEDIR